MSIISTIVALITIGIFCFGAFLFGFGMGNGSTAERNLELDRLTNARLQAIEAERRLHDLTRSAFMSMTRKVEERYQPEYPNGQRHVGLDPGEDQLR